MVSPDNPRISIVIRCYNEAAHIGKLFEEIKKQSLGDYEVLVVDSGSDDRTLEIVAGEDARVLHIEKEKFSFGRSLNIGCAEARGDLLVFISAHCYPEHEEWLAHLVDAFDDDEVAVVYGKQRGILESHFSELRIFRRWFPEESVGRQDNPFSNNANCAIRRELWLQNQYDESLTGLEDIAWAQRVMRAGWWVAYRADAGVVHVHNESPSQIRNRYRREAITFQKVFPAEHFNLWDLFRLTARNVGADWAAAAKESALPGNLWPIVRFRLSQFAGTYQGFHMRRPASSELKQHFYYPEN